MKEAAWFFVLCKNANAPKVCVENPIPHKYAVAMIGEKYTQIVQPWHHGHGEIKPICLWLKNLPPLIRSKEVSGREARIHKMAPSPERGKLRSVFYRGIAEAMVRQWT